MIFLVNSSEDDHQPEFTSFPPLFPIRFSFACALCSCAFHFCV